MKVLYVGDLTIGGTALQRAEALKDIGHELTLVDTALPLNGLVGVTNRVVRKLFGHALDFAGANRSALEVVASKHFEVVWVDKGLTIRPETLREIRERSRGPRIIAYSADDMSGRHNQSPRYLACVQAYDVHVTTKSFNVPELYEIGAKRVVFVDNAYDPATHRPLEVSASEREEYGADVAFVGTYEDDRARHIQELARAGILVDVWGSDWDRNRYSHRNVRIRGRPVYADEYAMVLNATLVNLCFLRKLNRDRQTTRSVEIPACGAFMLAERTEEHERLFTEGVEAEYFETPDELIEKCRFYLANEGARREIARKGRERCLSAGYSNQARLKCVLATIMAGRH